MSARAVREYVAGFKNDPDYDYKIEQHACIVEFINERYAVVERHPKGCVIVHILSGYAHTFDDFQNVFSSCNYKVRFHDHILHDKNLGTRWLKHPDRRQVETIEELEHER